MTMKKALLAATMLTLPADGERAAGDRPLSRPRCRRELGEQPGEVRHPGQPDGQQLRRPEQRHHFDVGKANFEPVGAASSASAGASATASAPRSKAITARTKWTASAASASRRSRRTGGYQSTYGAMAQRLLRLRPELPGPRAELHPAVRRRRRRLRLDRFPERPRHQRRAGAVHGVEIQADDIDANFAYQGIAWHRHAVHLARRSRPDAHGRVPLLRPSRARAPDARSRNAGNNGGQAGQARRGQVQPLGHARHPLRAVPAAAAGSAWRRPPPWRRLPRPARTYLVFFDWNRADLTARAREIIAEAAQNSRRVQSTRIEVAGHADRSGSPQYNQRLSQRRADVVAAELVAPRREPQRDRRHGLSARAGRWCRPRTACASRRTAASRSCCADLKWRSALRT